MINLLFVTCILLLVFFTHYSVNKIDDFGATDVPSSFSSKKNSVM